ncbi:MAG: periplasmic heavy metal sensor [Phycisphaerales bacterium]|nr:MAG: periplasmic heavy metal sensor [Phycisphaerales bacterium]
MRWTPSRNALPWWLLVVSLAFNVGFGATYGVRTYTPAPPEQPRDTRPGPPRRMREALKLTSDQSERFGEISRRLFEDTKELRSQMRTEHGALAGLLAEAEPDRDAIGVQLDTIASLQRELQELVIDNLLEQRELLEPEQIPAFSRVIQRYIGPRGGMGGFEGGRHGRRPGGGSSPGRDRGPRGRGERGPERDRGPGSIPPPDRDEDPGQADNTDHGPNGGRGH